MLDELSWRGESRLRRRGAVAEDHTETNNLREQQDSAAWALRLAPELGHKTGAPVVHRHLALPIGRDQFRIRPLRDSLTRQDDRDRRRIRRRWVNLRCVGDQDAHAWDSRRSII